MTGAYLAGLSVAFLPTRSHIHTKIDSLRTYGMTNFYFMLGISVRPSLEDMRRLVGWSFLVAGLVVFVMPVVWFAASAVVGLRARTRFYICCIGNSLGEFGLIIQILCYYAKIFNHDTHIGHPYSTRVVLLDSC